MLASRRAVSISRVSFFQSIPLRDGWKHDLDSNIEVGRDDMLQ